jgi:hypothetical protein
MRSFISSFTNALPKPAADTSATTSSDDCAALFNFV